MAYEPGEWVRATIHRIATTEHTYRTGRVVVANDLAAFVYFEGLLEGRTFLLTIDEMTSVTPLMKLALKLASEPIPEKVTAQKVDMYAWLALNY